MYFVAAGAFGAVRATNLDKFLRELLELRMQRLVDDDVAASTESARKKVRSAQHSVTVADRMR
jgi:hypothetical protein